MQFFKQVSLGNEQIMDRVLCPLNFSTTKTGRWTCILMATQNTSMGLHNCSISIFLICLKTQLKACYLPYLILWLLLAFTMLLNYICSYISVCSSVMGLTIEEQGCRKHLTLGGRSLEIMSSWTNTSVLHRYYAKFLVVPTELHIEVHTSSHKRKYSH